MGKKADSADNEMTRRIAEGEADLAAGRVIDISSDKRLEEILLAAEGESAYARREYTRVPRARLRDILRARRRKP